ncbi:MT-A70-domain-containing protein [Pyronema domesticum]|uniref:Similar to Methyltransferase-like protein 4 acc. no. Q3U034 n=1 Tax=Pyronema omphalodes (strain CBS 100304) TaxID=1076935 RepID=U4L3C7_PYROM|nr:MT-A70-domain-containing protein [Pyronema domesticum]CCX04555.1 Similar to Methyltransferase-like protein 4; acc. no. Q3U034 [Pyronema omphalodes CBS 100304]
MSLFNTSHCTVLDIPTTHSTPPGLRLRSSPAPIIPYKPTLQPTSDIAAHTRLLPRLLTALSSLPTDAPFHTPRLPPPNPEDELNFTDPNLLLCTTEPDLEDLEDPFDPQPCPETVDDLSDLLIAGILTNASEEWKTMTITHPTPSRPFHIPPRSSFQLGRITPASFAPLGKGTVDFLLLDPPWPSASAQRKRKRGTSGTAAAGGYRTENRFEIWELLEGLPVGEVLAKDGVVAVWITNAGRVRKGVEGLWKKWGLEERAEWCWVKITTSGEAVVSLEAEGKRGYEVLLMGARKGEASLAAPLARLLENKVVVGVPEVHSRKPCLRKIVEKEMPGHKGVEVFARCLTEGWTSFGDEVVRFNWEGWWGDEVECGEDDEVDKDKSTL